MTGMELALLILGIIVFVASFIVPETMRDIDGEAAKFSEDKVKEIVDSQMKDAKEKLQDAVDETVSYAIEKSERSLERISNEKITAVSEFSETVLSDINKNHQEVMFMYDMLHDKQKNLKETAIQVDKTNAMAKETKTELELVTKQIQEETLSEQLPDMTDFADFGEADASDTTVVTQENNFELLDLGKAAPKRKKRASKSKSEKIIEPVAIPVIAGGESEGNNNDRILELHKKGKSNIAIAKELGLGVGEVNLVIDLFEVM